MQKHITRAITCLLMLVFLASATLAQGASPRYIITFMKEGLSADNCRLEFNYLVSNNGAPSVSEAMLELRIFGQPERVLASAIIPPLQPGRPVTLELSTPAYGYPANTNQTFEVLVTVNGVDAFGATPRIVTLSIPPIPDTCRPAVAATMPLRIEFLDLTIDLANLRREEIIFMAALFSLPLLILLILLRLRRLLFGRAPAFGNYLPPYATTPPIDPHSQAGIRQSWQMYAQNNTIAQPSARGAHAVVKLLLGADGQYLNGWEIKALRLSQYDQYGRVARTTTAGTLRIVRTLNRLAHPRKPMDADQIERKVAPLARQLTRLLLKRVTERSAVLPVALDVRLQGSHGEVSIVFELYSGDGVNWHLLDRWQPEMSVSGKTIHETYTYTIHGQSGGESFKDFRQRLPLDMTRMLGELIAPRVRPPTPTPADTHAPRPPQTQGVQMGMVDDGTSHG